MGAFGLWETRNTRLASFALRSIGRTFDSRSSQFLEGRAFIFDLILYVRKSDHCQGGWFYRNNPRVPKSIIFLDSKTECEVLAQYLRQLLIAKTEHLPASQQYCVGGNAPAYDVFSIVETFHADIAKYDQDLRYAEFLKEKSKIRIIVATTSLGIGVNVPDVAVIVNWKFPIDSEVREIWQRAGRGGRKEGMVSHAYFFFPYWAFDSEGRDDPTKPAPPPTQPARKQRRQPKRQKNTLPLSRRRSRLENSINASHLSDNEFVATLSLASDNERPASSADVIPDMPEAPEDTRPFWNKTEAQQRANLPACWKELCNTPCKRKPILDRLGEGKLPPGEAQVSPPEKCCNGCNKDLAPILVEAPEVPALVTKPRAKTYAGVALSILEKWAHEHTRGVYNHPNRRFPVPTSAFLPTKCLWSLAHLYGCSGTHKKTEAFWEGLDLATLLEEIPSIKDWRYLDRSKDDLLRQLRGMIDQVNTEYAETKAKAKAKAAEAAQAEGVSAVPLSNTQAIELEETMARRVAIRNMRDGCQISSG